jgi:AcrR family transcriptional regulator
VNLSATTLRDRQREHTRSEIVRVAFELFAKRGYEKVSVEMIAAEAGISRATFFNYFPQKSSSSVRSPPPAQRNLKAIIGALLTADRTPTIDSLMQAILKLAEENARITVRSKKLILETVFHNVSRGPMMAAREQAVEALTVIFARILKAAPARTKLAPKLIAEVVMSIFLATMLEWLMRDGLPQKWLPETMRSRLQLVLSSVQEAVR